MEYLLHILILVGIYAILATSLNLIAGYAGLMSICHAAFYGIGAYTVALMTLYVHRSPTIATAHYSLATFLMDIFLGMIFAGIVGIIVAWPSLRIHDDYFVIVTFGFQMIAFSILNNWVDFTKGPLGIPGIPWPELFGFKLTSHWHFLILSWLFATAIFYLVARLLNSPYGRVLRAIREDEIFAESLGKNVVYYKLSVFVVGGALASVAGALYATYVTFIDPTSFTLLESVLILSMVIVGGSGNLSGSLLGAFLLVVIPEGLRFVGLPSAVAANVRQILYGSLLVLFMLFRPQGILTERAGSKKIGSKVDDE